MGDASAGPQRGKSGRVAVGHYTLVVGDTAGVVLVPTDGDGETTAAGRGEARALRRAIGRSRRRRRRGSPAERLESGLDDAETVTGKVERTIGLCTEVAGGRLDVKSLSDEIDALVGLLARLDRGERWQEALRVARCVSMLLALAGRWLELLRSLQIALRAAERLGDPLGEAWALHELGTLHLAVGRHGEADRLLGRAREIRDRCGDRRGLAVTDRNLQVLCRSLRRLLHRRRPGRALEALLRRPAFALLAAAALFAVGGTAGAVIGHAQRRRAALRFHPATATFSFAPAAPHAGQSVVFTARAADAQDPVASYAWRWGDGDPSGERVQRHVYSRPGRYLVVLSVRDADGRVTARVTRAVIVERPSSLEGPTAAFTTQPRTAAVREPVSFDASSSFDPKAAITRYEWKFGDGRRGEGVKTQTAYRRAGLYTVTLTIADRLGRRSTLSQLLAVSSGRTRMQAELTIACAPSSLLPGQALTTTGRLTPPRSGATVKIIYTGPSGPPLARATTTSSAGFYQDEATPSTLGSWSVQSSVAGDRDYLPSTSEACPFTVESSSNPGHGTTREKKLEELRLKEEREAKKSEAARLREAQAKREQEEKQRQQEREREEAREREREEEATRSAEKRAPETIR